MADAAPFSPAYVSLRPRRSLVAFRPALLLTARALQGVASAMTAPAALSLLITTFADEKQRARVLGLNGSLLSGGFTVGRFIARRGAHTVLLVALLVQGGLTAPMILLGTQPVWLWLLI